MSEPPGPGRRSPGALWSRIALPLRTRLALLTAVAVAVAVAVCATAAWFVVRGQLLDSLDAELRDHGIGPVAVIEAVRADRCVPDPKELPGARLVPFPGTTVQVVDTQGTHCVLAGTATLEVTDTDVAIAGRPHTEKLHDVTGSDGERYRVLTQHLPGTDLALSVARPLSEVNDPLRALALVLALVAAAGAVGAAGVGVALARAGLRPVNRLTAAAEHIARTEDLSVRLPVNEAGAARDDEIARLSRSFNSMTTALASSRETQQQLIADAGHELRTPLTSLRTNIELLARSEETGRPLPPDDKRRLLSSLTDQLTELGGLVGDLQELSRPEPAPGATGAAGGPGGARPEVVGLHEVTRRALRRVALRAGGATRLDVAELAPWYVRAEPAALERAVVNLLDNAVKFGGTTTQAVAASAAATTDDEAPGRGVQVRLAGGVLRIRDHGPGIDPAELPHVFERFWRSPSARGLPGSGLGLSIVARTVRAYGGEVSLHAAAGGGTEAVLRLPGAPAADTAGTAGTGDPADAEPP